ncbi:MAG: phosphatase PAP2 family protein [Oscillospiraceae bacterium]|nr:phosphatase PAP2 family protein [Oscillospiraceae bacterium]
MLEQMHAIDASTLIWIQTNLRTPVLDAVFSLYTRLGHSGALFLALSVLLLCFRRTRKAGVLGMVAIGVGALMTNVTLKPLIARARPWVSLEEIVPLVTESDPNAFPSGHTCAAFAMAGTWLWAQDIRKLKILGFVLACVMGFSRLYVGVHYLSDVLVGCAVGLFAAWLVYIMWHVLLSDGRRLRTLR